jgi:hypothetical protein
MSREFISGFLLYSYRGFVLNDFRDPSYPFMQSVRTFTSQKVIFIEFFNGGIR